MGCKYHFVVEKVSGKIEVDSVETNLIAGIEQLMSLTLHTGSNNIDKVCNKHPKYNPNIFK